MLQQCITKRAGSISWTTACNAAAIHKEGGKHQTLQRVGLINIWTAAEVSQTEPCQRVSAAQLASISRRKHVSDKRQIRPRQFYGILSSRVHLAILDQVNSPNTPPLLWQHLWKWLSLFNSKSVYLSSLSKEDYLTIFDLTIRTICFLFKGCML